MPGPFINNSGYEPIDWDTPETAKEVSAKPARVMFRGHKADAGPIDLQMSSKGCALLICGGTAVKLGEWAMAKIYEAFDQTRPKALANQYDAHEQIHDALGAISSEIYSGNIPILGASDERLMQHSLEKSKRIRELLEEIEKVAKS
jgi:hypothetical protein